LTLQGANRFTGSLLSTKEQLITVLFGILQKTPVLPTATVTAAPTVTATKATAITTPLDKQL